MLHITLNIQSFASTKVKVSLKTTAVMTIRKSVFVLVGMMIGGTIKIKKTEIILKILFFSVFCFV